MLLVVMFTGEDAAAAGDKQACLDAYREAQRGRRDEDLLRAREQLLVCARQECPSVVHGDCVTWLDEVQRAMPSIVLSARSEDGRDLVDVQVTMDGKPLASSLNGKSIDVNPGVHVFRFVFGNLPAVEQKLIVQKAEKDRVIRVTFAATPGTKPAGSSPASVQAKSRPVPVWAWVAAGAGLIGWGGLAYFGVRFDQKYGELERCDPNCPSSKIDEASTTRTLAFVSLGVGVVGTGLAAVLYFTRPEVAAPARDNTVSFGVTPTPGGAAAIVRASF
jgi:hypothetical protein